MNEDFITEGIENDRYLKAVRLADVFENEVARRIANVSKQTVARCPEFFPADVSPQENSSKLRTEPLAHMRADNEMLRVNEDGKRLRLHFAIEWANPSVHMHDDTGDGALCIVLYKIKDLDRAEYDAVKRKTEASERWDAIQFDDDLWNSDLGLFYVPVDSGSAVETGFETLQEHFLEFKESFGEWPSESSP